MILSGKTALIYGYGASGKSAAKLWKRQGATVKVFDDDPAKRDFLTFEEWSADLSDVDFVVMSPGVDGFKTDLLELRLGGIPVISEIELGYGCCFGEIIAITGTNGKTSATMLTNEILLAGGFSSYALGNIGTPFCDMADKFKSDEIAVLEISSFQLETSTKFTPDIGVLLNIEPDHLDRHKSFEDYAKTKIKLFKNQSENDFAIFNEADETISELMRGVNSQKIPFNIYRRCDGAYIENGIAYFKGEEVLSLEDSPFAGRENENLLAAVAVAKLKGIPNEKIAGAVKNFIKPPHRMELFCTAKGKKFIDDSKATNISATISAVESIKEPAVLILGGCDKGEDFLTLFKSLPKLIKRVLVIGENAKSILHAAKLCEYRNIESFDNMNSLIKSAIEGDESIVLFSPASKSFDRYKNYAERGDHFKKLVEANL